MTVAPHRQLPSQPLLRLRLAPHSGGPRAIDGAWWPRSYDLVTELPALLAGLPPAWGHIESVMFNGMMWQSTPGRILVADQIVRLSKGVAATAEHTVVLLAPGRGRWDLLVVPPDATDETAARIMARAGSGQPSPWS